VETAKPGAKAEVAEPKATIVEAVPESKVATETKPEATEPAPGTPESKTKGSENKPEE
jgi:hypothetical protein